MADFAFTDYSGKEFVIRLTNEQRIAEARRILSGEETMSTHVMGRIRKRAGRLQPGLVIPPRPGHRHLLHDGHRGMRRQHHYVDDHLDEACGPFLPGCFWCPWSSRLTREVS